MKRHLTLLIIACIVVSAASPLWAEGEAQSTRKNPQHFPYSILLSEIRTSLENLSMYVMSYSITHRREIPDKIRDCMKTIDRAFVEAYKVTPMKDKGRMKELRSRYNELKPVAEDVFEMEELYGINVNEAVEKTLRAHAVMENKIMKEALLRAKEEDVAQALPLFYEMDSSLSRMLWKTLLYLRDREPGARKEAFDEHIALSASLEACVRSAKAMKVDVKLLNELKSYIVDAMRCTQDAMEDFDRLEPRLRLFLGKVESMIVLMGGEKSDKPEEGK